MWRLLILQVFSAVFVVPVLQVVHLRWGSTKLRELCSGTLGIVPDASTMFLFTNKSRDCLLMYFTDEAGDQMMMKKLDKGAFLLPVPEHEGAPFVIMKPAVLPRLFRS